MPKFLLAIGMFCFFSCEKEPKPVVVTHELIRQVDTTFQRQYKDSIRKEFDSLCQRNYDDTYLRVKDSLMKVELKKIESLFE